MVGYCAVVYEVARASLWSGLLVCLIGIGFIAYGAKQTPHQFNPLNMWRRPLPAVVAKLIYYPIGIVFILFGVREIIRVLEGN